MPPEIPRDHPAIIDRLQGELAVLGAMADNYREALSTATGQLELANARVRSLIEERDALHVSLASRQETEDQLRERIALLEAEAVERSAQVEDAQARLEWQAMDKALRDQRRDAPVIIIEASCEASPAIPAPAISLEAPPPAVDLSTPPEGRAEQASGPNEEVRTSLESPPAAPPLPVTGGRPARASAPTRGDWSTAKVPPEIDKIVEDMFRAGAGPEAIARAVTRAGKPVNEHWAKNRARKLGLTLADREVKPTRGPKSPAGQAIVKAANVPAVVPALPVTPTPPRTRLLNMWGKMVEEYVNQGMDPDEIARSINAELAKSDHITAKQVRQVQLELKRLARDGRAA